MENRKKRKKIIIISLIIVVIICMIFSTIFALLNLANEKIINGVFINNIDVSNSYKEDILNKFSELIDNAKNREILLKYDNDIQRTFTLDEIEIKYEIENAVNKAFLVGRNNNIFVNNFEIIQTLINQKNINIVYTYNKEKLNSIISEINSSLPGAIKQYDYSVEDEELIISKGKEGIAIDEDDLLKKINFEINSLIGKSDIIELKVNHMFPKEIDIEKIHKEIYKEPQDAYITEEPKTVHPNVNGVDFAITLDEAKELLNEDKEEYIIPLKITVANKTLSDLGAEAFPNELGTYYTKFNVANTNRSTNVKLASDKINGTIVLPGETFSYNKTVGKRTIEAGFKEAGAYAGGKVVQEVGGGICQVSSTLYNAVLYANLEIVERYNHYFETSYVPLSRDATVSWGSVDFKFKNTRTYPIKIISTCKNGVETVSIYGIPEETEYEVIIQDKRISIIERNTKYEEDDTIEKGKEVIEQTGHDGCTSEAYKLLRLDGKTVSTTLLSKDKYYPLDRIIKIGTKEVVETVAPVNQQENTTTEEEQEESQKDNNSDINSEETPKDNENLDDRNVIEENVELNNNN